MPAQTRCTACSKYEERQENFCRVCGLEFTPDKPPQGRNDAAYTSAEKYCGNCGCTRGNCDCR
jgi:rubredoxin